MGVKEAILQVEYGIKKMKENATPFEFYFKGTLVNLKGALDYLLDEYNSKYSVGIGDNEDLSISEFRKRVKGKNSHAESFIEAYDKERAKLFADPKCGKLLTRHGSRDITVHRRELPKKITIALHESVTISAHVEARDESGKLVGTADSRPEPVPLSAPPEVHYFLPDWTNDDIPSLCEYTLNEVKKFVTALRANYP